MPQKKENIQNKEDTLDITLRPKKWDDYVGQKKIKENIKILVTAAKQRHEPPCHLLFHGNPGLGKTTIAHLIADEIGADFKVTSGPSIEKAGDLAAILTNLASGDVLFIDEIHRVGKIVEEYLYPAMEDFKLNLILGKGPMARTMSLDVPKFTLIGATTRLAGISSPMRSRFGSVFGLNFYSNSDIEQILKRSSRILNIETELDAFPVLAKCSRYTPRTANHILKIVRDFAQVKGEGKITKQIAQTALDHFEIDNIGLSQNDRRILQAIISKFGGGPVGLQGLAAATAEEQETILNIYEPYLMRLGFIARTPKGRIATKLAYVHLNIKPPENQPPLF